MTGGRGADTLAGFRSKTTSNDGERDTYRYLNSAESGQGENGRDVVWGFFNGGGPAGDKIDLSAVKAGTLDFIGAGNFGTTSGGEVRVLNSGANYLVQIDTNADAEAEMSILVHSPNALVKGDFLL